MSFIFCARVIFLIRYSSFEAEERSLNLAE